MVAQTQLPSPGADLSDWIGSGRSDFLGGLLVLELALAIIADILGRASSLVDSLLSERYSNFASVRLVEHATTLDREQFESNDQQDRLERARRQVTGPTTHLTRSSGKHRMYSPSLHFPLCGHLPAAGSGPRQAGRS